MKVDGVVWSFCWRGERKVVEDGLCFFVLKRVFVLNVCVCFFCFAMRRVRVKDGFDDCLIVFFDFGHVEQGFILDQLMKIKKR